MVNEPTKSVVRYMIDMIDWDAEWGDRDIVWEGNSRRKGGAGVKLWLRLW